MALDVVLRDNVTAAAIHVDVNSNGLITSSRPLGYDMQYTASGITGTMAAALAANSTVFILYNAFNATRNIHITSFSVQFVTIAAFTAPVTAGRRLELYRGLYGTTAPTGGTAVLIAQKLSNGSVSKADPANGGACQISSTGTLTTTGLTFETSSMGTMTLTSAGAAGAYRERLFDWTGSNEQAIELLPGESISIRNPIAMDAGGTWNIAITVNWYEEI